VSKIHTHIKTCPKYCLFNIFTYNICVFYTVAIDPSGVERRHLPTGIEPLDALFGRHSR
jgi:hypothetical protein